MEKEKISEKAVQILSKMIQLLGLEAEISFVKTETGENQCSLKTEDAGRLIGRKGQSISSLELLLNRIMKRCDKESPWFSLELDGYTTGNNHHNRESIDYDRFTQMALDTAKEVKRWKIEKKLGPFAAGERRAIHIALKEDPDVVTESETIPGDKFHKLVVVKRAD
ncbi:MAG: KH domain-containing protein [Lentisphaeria bacterium]